MAKKCTSLRVEGTGESNHANQAGAGVTVVERLRGNARLLAPKEVAQILGVHQETVYLLIRNDGLPSIRVGRARRVDSASLAEWIAERSSC